MPKVKVRKSTKKKTTIRVRRTKETTTHKKPTQKKSVAIKRGKLKLPTLDQLTKTNQSYKYPLVHKQVFDFLSSTARHKRGRAKLIRRTYREVFGNKAPLGTTKQQIRMAIAYKMQLAGYTLAGIRPPDRVVQNHDAALAFNVEAMTDNMKTLVHLNQHTEESQNEMAKAKKKKLKKKKTGQGQTVGPQGRQPYVGVKTGMGITDFYVHTFGKTQKKRKLSDVALCKAFTKEYPMSPRKWEPQMVRAMRSLYNRGNLPPQESTIPQVQCSEYDNAGMVTFHKKEMGGRKAKTKPKKKGAKSKARKLKKKTTKRKAAKSKARIRRRAA